MATATSRNDAVEYQAVKRNATDRPGTCALPCGPPLVDIVQYMPVRTVRSIRFENGSSTLPRSRRRLHLQHSCHPGNSCTKPTRQ